MAKTHSNLNVSFDPTVAGVTFEASPFGQLINMLLYGCIRRSTLLTDKLLRLLSLISLGIPDTSGYGRKVLLEEPETPQDPTILITESHLRLIVEVITSKNCTEEGLEEATSLLLNLSYGPPTTRDKVIFSITLLSFLHYYYYVISVSHKLTLFSISPIDFELVDGRGS